MAVTTVGPWGGKGGGAWDDGVHSGIRQLIIKHGSGLINSIQIEYDNGGNSVQSYRHGGNGGGTSVVMLKYPEEYLISMHGFYDRDSSNDWIRSITFETNKMTHGPFGDKIGDYFSLPTKGCKIVGFHGKSGDYLDAIGVHLKPI